MPLLTNILNLANLPPGQIIVSPGGTVYYGAAPTTPDATADNVFGATATTQTPLVVQGVALQTDSLQEWQTSEGEVQALISAAGNEQFANDIIVSWSSTDDAGGTQDTGLARNAAGVLEVNNGTAGTLRDVKARTLTTFQGAVEAPALGSGALTSATGANNTAVGVSAGNAVVAGTDDTFVGYHAGLLCTGSQMVGIGSGALAALTNGTNHTAVGYQALNAQSVQSNCTAVGYQALKAGTQGNNTAVGASAGAALTIAADCVFIGYNAAVLMTGTTASRGKSVAIGSQALASLVNPGPSHGTVAIGYFSMNVFNATSTGNTAIGYQALVALTGGGNNTAVGYLAGNTIVTGTDNTCLGANAEVSANADTNEIVIGSGITGNGTHTVTIGSGTDSWYMGLIAKYNGVAATGWGVPAIYGTGNTVGAVAQITSNSTYTVGAADGTFLIACNVLVTTATLHSFSCEVAYTSEDGTARILTLSFTLLAGGSLGTLVTNANGTVPYEYVPVCIRAQAGTTITVRTNAGGTYTTVVFSMRSSIQQIS